MFKLSLFPVDTKGTGALPRSVITSYSIHYTKLYDVVTAANHNTPEQVVISGEAAGLDAATKLVEEAGGKVVALNVSIANHSPLVAGVV